MESRTWPEEWQGVLEDTDGHQMVVAGPGTGKTEFLIRRVEHIVARGLANRDEILMLSFSRRASADLKRRVNERIGVGGVPVEATSFHSLALRLIEAAEPGHRPVPLTTPEQIDLVGRVLASEDPSGWPLTYRKVLTFPAFAGEVADFLMRCSERLLGPDDLDTLARERADWRGLPDLYRRYLEELAGSGRSDYGTLLSSAVALLRAPGGRDLARRFRYVLVDEYQDTSPAQAEMARLLADPHGNLTVTGDPYQSIYSFRGAELHNVARFSLDHPDARRVVLARSFRVPKEILDCAVRVVSPGFLPGEAGAVEPAPHQGRVEAYVFDQETSEADWIAHEVERAIRVDGVHPSRVAVLARSKRELFNELSRALGRRGIPHDPPQARLVDHPAVRLFHDLVVVAQHGGSLPATPPGEAAAADRAMRRILLGPLIALPLGRERSLLRARRRRWAAWAEVIRDDLPEHGYLASLLDDPGWAAEQSATDGFWYAWSGLRPIEAMVAAPDRGDWRRAWSAFAQVLARQAERDPDMSLSRFFALTEEEDFEATPLISHRPTIEGVTLTTLHQAKGLEFDMVFIANAVEGVFPDLRRSRRMLRPELLSPERATDPERQHLFQLQEEMRLAYTAMTRARLRVVWTATEAGVDQGERRPSRFLRAAVDPGSPPPGPPAPRVGDPVTLVEAQTGLRLNLLDPGVESSRRLAAARVLARPEGKWWDPEAFAGVLTPGDDAPILSGRPRLSPSQAEAYRSCPRQYALERRLRLGDAASPHAQFGALVHSALELAERAVVGTGRRHAEAGAAIDALHEVWRDADFGTPELTAAWLDKARDTVLHLYQAWPADDGEPVGLEQEVSASIGGVEWLGVIDRIEETALGLRIVDYKTSTLPVTKPEAARSIQLAFYAMSLIEQGHHVVEAAMWYPRHPARSVTTRHLDMSLLPELQAEMGSVAGSILGEDWWPSPGDHCKRCSFRLSCPAWAEGRGAFVP